MRVKGSFKYAQKRKVFIIKRFCVYIRQKDRNVGIYFEGEEFVWIIYIVEFVLIETCFGVRGDVSGHSLFTQFVWSLIS
jgi:hypothetical protein